jgi:hypothetical protein
MLLGTIHHVIILNGKTEKGGPQNMLFCNYIFQLTLCLYHFQYWITPDVRHKGGQVPTKHQQDSGTEAAITVAKINWLLLYSKRVAICCENHTEHINTVCVEKLQFSNANTGGVYSNQYAFKG